MQNITAVHITKTSDATILILQKVLQKNRTIGNLKTPHATNTHLQSTITEQTMTMATSRSETIWNTPTITAMT